MIVSDHGMAETGLGSGVTYIKIEDYLDLNDVSLIVGGSFSAVVQVSPHPGKIDEVTKKNFSLSKESVGELLLIFCFRFISN